MIRLITLDLDNTLWDVYPVLRRAEQIFREWLETNYPELAAVHDLEHAYRIRAELLKAQPELKGLPTRLRKAVLHRLFATAPGWTMQRLHPVIEEGFEVFHRARNEIPLFPETPDVLKALSSRLPLIAISNGNADVHLVGIGEHFQHHLSADATGTPKPHPGMFEKALQLSGTAADECLHVGDHPEEDVAAAQRVGMRAVWFNPERKAWPLEQVSPDFELNELSDLPELVERLLQSG